MDREAQLKLLTGTRASLQQQQETLKKTLQELSVQVNELNKLIEWLLPPPTPLVELVAAANMAAAARPAATQAPVTAPISLAKPARTLRSLDPPKKEDRFMWNGEEYAVVNVLGVPGEGSFNFRAKPASRVKMPGKPFDFRWERSGFTVAIEPEAK